MLRIIAFGCLGKLVANRDLKGVKPQEKSCLFLKFFIAGTGFRFY